jgi:NAD(P)-dependent dehydrogenase (short-subunit alcohol dehydrogenase family)
MRGLGSKRLLVAGSATGIGAVTARRLAEEGARLHLGDLNIEGATVVANEICDAGGDAVATRFDLADSASIDALVADAVAHLGGLDGVANVAADLSPSTIGQDHALLEMDAAVWEQTFRADLLGFALICKCAIPHLADAGGGSIVNVTSDAHWLGEAVRPAYAAAKSGITALSRHIARAYGAQGVRANSVSPGAVVSEAFLAAFDEEFAAKALEGLAVPRLGKPEDLVSAVAFLLSDDAQWISGQVWSVNGGSGFRG